MTVTNKTFLPSVTAIQHLYWNASNTTDAHGNPTGGYSDPVNENIICWWVLERRTWAEDPVDPDVVARTEDDIHMLVNDPSIYTKRDRVIVNGLLFEVQGVPTDWSSGLPFQAASYGMLVGGEVHARRVSSTGVLAGM